MKIELVDEFPTENYFGDHLVDRRWLITGALCITASTVPISEPLAQIRPATSLAVYLIRKINVPTLVRASEEIRAWIDLINSGGLERLRQVMIASLTNPGGYIEDQERVPIESDPGIVSRYHVSSEPRETGSKSFSFKTEADFRRQSILVK